MVEFIQSVLWYKIIVLFAVLMLGWSIIIERPRKSLAYLLVVLLLFVLILWTSLSNLFLCDVRP